MKKMSSIFLWLFVAEIMLAMFVVWGFVHEDRFIAFEKRVASLIRKAVRK